VPRLRLLWVGRTRDADLARCIDRYVQRLGRYATVEVDVAPEPKGAFRPEEVMRLEGAALLARLAARGRRLGLDPAGTPVTSEGLARQLEQAFVAGGGQAQFVLGGPSGLAEEVAGALDLRISLSPLTLTHEMARLLLVEQLYRAFTILRGEPYHR
jgi:23S rRNA (pseudouridine1915-N3)-methyltransferase